MVLQCTIVFLSLSALAAGQASVVPSLSLATDYLNNVPSVAQAPFDGLTSPLRVTPDTALKAYEERSLFQKKQLESSSSTTLILAELSDTARQGELEVLRWYTAPSTLRFTTLRYDGDPFVKRNVIARLLQSEVDRVQDPGVAQTALDRTNYKFSFLTTSTLDGRLVHVYRVKPRVKRLRLFKGKIYLDAAQGRLVRAEGSLVKLSSFFLRKVDFIQDYADFGDFTFPVHLHSEILVRMIGHVLVDVYNRDYKVVKATPAQCGF